MPTDRLGLAQPRIFIHIGTHKTGSTSLQYFLDRERCRLRNLGVAYFRGCHIPANHVELHAASMRIDRPSPFKLDSQLTIDAEYIGSVKARLADFVQGAGNRVCLFSAEGLSYLRYVDEVEALKELFPPADISIFVYLRDRESYRRSHQGEFNRRVARGGKIDPSFADLGIGSWLLDYEARLEPFKAAFGEARVHVVDFDQARENDGSIIPSCLRLLGVEGQFLPSDWESIALNAAPP